MHIFRQHPSLAAQWGIFLIAGTAALLGGFSLAGQWWPDPEQAIRWVALSLAAHVYFTGVLLRGLPLNHRPGESMLLPSLGLANALTLLRAVLMSAVVGFLLSPRPEGWSAWLPGVLYTAASLPDYIDGIVARKTNHVTRLGEILDMNVDSVGVFTATFLAYRYGVVPWWYLPIGLARYLFVAGILVREKLGLPVHELPFSHRRRGFAALKMGFMFVMLFPLFGPPGTHVAAAAFGIPFLIAFVWDWALVAGWVRPETGDRFDQWKKLVLTAAPWLLRFLAVALILPVLGDHFRNPDLQLLAWLEAGITVLLAAGIAPRSAAIAAVCLVGVNQNIAPLDPEQLALIVVYIALIFLGSGRFSLWPVEEMLVMHRFGDPD